LEKIGFSGLAIPLEKGEGNELWPVVAACMQLLPLLGTQRCEPTAVQRATTRATTCAVLRCWERLMKGRMAGE